MTYNISYEDDALSATNASGDLDKVSGLKYGDVFNEGTTTAKSEIDSSCEDLTCTVSCSCNTANGWKSSHETSRYISITSKRSYAKSGSVTCYKDTECDNSNGYYENKPSDNFTYTESNGCYKVTGCRNGCTSSEIPSGFGNETVDIYYYVPNGGGNPVGGYGCVKAVCPTGSVTSSVSSSDEYFTTSSPKTTSKCLVGQSSLSCYELSCKNDVTKDSAYFNVSSSTRNGKTCYKATSCKSPYVSTANGTAVAESNGIKCYNDKCYFTLKVSPSAPTPAQGATSYSWRFTVTHTGRNVNWRDGSVSVEIGSTYVCVNGGSKAGKSTRIQYQGSSATGSLNIGITDIKSVCGSSGGTISSVYRSSIENPTGCEMSTEGLP